MSESNPTQAEQFRRLQWQCRRGIKEVEVLLVPFFDTHYAALAPADQALFEKLLEQHDVEMFEWFTHRSLPQQPDLARIVKMVLYGVDA
jgi:antitoxin CptB